MSAVADWVRPWFPGGLEGHVDPECPDLLAWVSEPVEGAGWLLPRGALVCRTCIPSWDAECVTCGLSLTGDEDREDDYPFSEADADAWLRGHTCNPIVFVTAPPSPEPAPILAGQAPLF